MGHGNGIDRRDQLSALVDVHVHAGAPPGAEEMVKEIHSPQDWATQRSKDPVHFAEVMSQEQVDNSDLLIKTMDDHGVTHALIQMTPGIGASNQLISAMARKHNGRFFPIYRPEFLMGAVGSGDLTTGTDKTSLSTNAERMARDIETLFPQLGMIGVGEMSDDGDRSGRNRPRHESHHGGARHWELAHPDSDWMVGMAGRASLHLRPDLGR